MLASPPPPRCVWLPPQNVHPRRWPRCWVEQGGRKCGASVYEIKSPAVPGEFMRSQQAEAHLHTHRRLSHCRLGGDVFPVLCFAGVSTPPRVMRAAVRKGPEVHGGHLAAVSQTRAWEGSRGLELRSEVFGSLAQGDHRVCSLAPDRIEQGGACLKWVPAERALRFGLAASSAGVHVPTTLREGQWCWFRCNGPVSRTEKPSPVLVATSGDLLGAQEK